VNEESPGHRADLAAGFAVGSLLGGYRLEEQVGAGGMAVVFRARDERLNRLVALKIMTPAMGSDDMFRQRFIRESRAAAAVDDPHIIPVYEAGEAGQVLFIAMRFVQGGDVRTLLRREGPLPPERVASIFSPVASALDAAHAVGLVHRDVKPANILLDRRPGRPEHVYLSDFGLSKSAEVSLGLTAAGQFLGTPDYTAPEQIEGLPVDGRTDQYALACAVFELLTGRAPFHRDDSFAAIWAHLHKPPPSLVERRTELSPAVDAVMAKALAKPQVDRYPTCWEFAEALRDALGLGPYHLGSTSDPGLSWTAPRGETLPPSSAASPPAAPGQKSGPGANGAGLPPGEDTEASKVYPERPLSLDSLSRLPAKDSASTSTPDDQATDPGHQVRRENHRAGPEDHLAGPEDHLGRPEDRPAGPEDHLARPEDHPAGPEDRPASPDGPAGDQDEAVPSPARQASGFRGQAAGLAPARPAPSRSKQAPPHNKPGGPGERPGGPGTGPGLDRRGRRRGRRRATFLTLTGAGVLVTAVVLILVLNTLLGSSGGHHKISGSAWSHAYGPPQVAGSLSSVAFSPNGQVLAVGGSGGSQSGSQPKDTTYLLNAVSGDRIKALSPGGGAEAFSPDGAMLATAGGPHDSVTYLWGVHSGGTLTTLDDHHGSTVRSVSFSPSGRMLAADDKNGVVYLWTLHGAPGALTASGPGSVSPPGGPNVNAVAFSPRGTILALGGNDGQAYLFDTATESTTRTLFTPDNSAVTSVAFNSSGALLAASKMDGTTYVWNLDTRHHVSLDDPDDAIIESVAFSPNGKWLATGDADGHTYLWDLAAKQTQIKPAKVLPNPTSGAASGAGNAVFSVAFGPDNNTLATTDTNGYVYLWRVR
jgi:serine/threonine protein kinase/WD40 repeat protein